MTMTIKKKKKKKEYSVSLSANYTVQGRLYLTLKHLCFNCPTSESFGNVTLFSFSFLLLKQRNQLTFSNHKIVISFSDVTDIEKKQKRFLSGKQIVVTTLRGTVSLTLSFIPPFFQSHNFLIISLIFHNF